MICIFTRNDMMCILSIRESHWSIHGSAKRTTVTSIMYHPLPIPYRKGVILRDLQIIHHLRAMHTPPPCNNPNTTIGSQDVHSLLDIPCWRETFFSGQEGMLTRGMYHLILERDGFAVLHLLRGGDGQIN